MALRQLDVYEALDFTIQLYVKNQLEYEIIKIWAVHNFKFFYSNFHF